MTAPHFVRTAALSLVLALGVSGASFAAALTAETTTTANLRKGPGTSYAIIDSLPAGTEVTVEACTNSWCAVTTEDDEEGFIARSLLDVTGEADQEDDGSNIVITPPPPPGIADGQVCFYQQKNYKGANFCVEPGDKDAHIPGSFNNNIESIRVEGDAVVKVCADPYYDTCAIFDHSVNKLPLHLDNEISSYIVSSGDDGIPDLPEDDNPDGAVIILH
jgi:hypothetical protein